MSCLIQSTVQKQSIFSLHWYETSSESLHLRNSKCLVFGFEWLFHSFLLSVCNITVLLHCGFSTTEWWMGDKLHLDAVLSSSLCGRLRCLSAAHENGAQKWQQQQKSLHHACSLRMREQIRHLTVFEPCVAAAVVCVRTPACLRDLWRVHPCVHWSAGELAGLCRLVQWNKKKKITESQTEYARTRQSGSWTDSPERIENEDPSSPEHLSETAA